MAHPHAHAHTQHTYARILWTRAQAEKLNGRAAMVGYFIAIFVDKFTGHGLLEQQNSFLGLLALHISVFGILAIR